MSDKNDNWWMEMDRQSDIENLEGFKETKELLLENDNLETKTLNDDLFFDQLHDRIMAGVETTQIQRDGRTFWERHQRLGRGAVAAVALMALMLAGVETQQSKMVADSTELVLHDVVAQTPDVDESILVYQAKDDFFVDIAKENLDQLSVDNIEGIVRNLPD